MKLAVIGMGSFGLNVAMTLYEKGAEVLVVDRDKEKVEKVLDEKVRPTLIADGGNVQLVDVDEEKGIVTISFTNKCATCPYAQLGTLNFIKDTLTSEIPGIKEVKTD